MHGARILDVEDLAKPRFVSGLDWSPRPDADAHGAAVRFRCMDARHAGSRRGVAKLEPGRPVSLALDITHEQPARALRELPGELTESPSRT